MIYLDANATTTTDPAVVEAMLPFWIQQPGNPSAGHASGRVARRAIEKARGQVADLLGVHSAEILFTSGATESINSVHHSVQQQHPDRTLLLIGATEHAATLACAERWQAQGGRVHHIPVESSGRLDMAALERMLEPGLTALVSVLWANNETGVIQPLDEITRLAHAAGALVHADAVQMLGKHPVNLQSVPVDFLSLSAHKMHGPKGIGALFIHKTAPFQPLIIGGGQEAGRRSGTENVPGIVGLGQAAELASQHLAENPASCEVLRDAFEEKLLAALPDLHIHSRQTQRLPNTSSIHFPGVDAAALLIRLDQKGLACSAGSACHTASLHPSHVLEAMGYDARHASSTVRFSLSRFTTAAEVDTAANLIHAAVLHLRTQWDPGVLVTITE